MKTIKTACMAAGLLTLAAGLALPLTALSQERDADELIQRGRYLAQVSGCNDCHTPGYFMSDGQVPETLWLTGDNFGWRGPWGTTYGSNLRLYLQSLSEEEWVRDARTLRRRPPMPWFNLNVMEEDDLRALYHYIRSLGEPGRPAPAYVPPDQEPTTAYARFPSPPPR